MKLSRLTLAHKFILKSLEDNPEMYVKRGTTKSYLMQSEKEICTVRTKTFDNLVNLKLVTLNEKTEKWQKWLHPKK